MLRRKRARSILMVWLSRCTYGVSFSDSVERIASELHLNVVRQQVAG